MKIDGRKLLGLPRSASSAEVRERCEDLLDWLESADVPNELRPWLEEQKTLLSGLSEHPELVNETQPAQSPVAKDTPKVGRPKRSGEVRKVSFISWPTGRPIVLVLIGVVAGLAVLSAVLLSGVLDSGNNNTQTPDTIGLSAAEKAANQEQIRRLEEAIKADPKNLQMLFDLGELNISNGNWAESIRWFTKLLAVEPTNIHTKLDFGTANLQLGNHKEAYDALPKVLAMDPRNVSAHYNLWFLQAFRTDAPNLADAAFAFPGIMGLMAVHRMKWRKGATEFATDQSLPANLEGAAISGGAAK